MKLIIIKASSLITMRVEIEIIVAMDFGNHWMMAYLSIYH